MPPTHSQSSLPALWHESAPRHFDARLPWWIKALLVAALSVLAILFVDRPIAAWALQAHPLDEHGAWNLKSDIIREIGMLEQYGQWVCSVLLILAVALLDRSAGRRRALAIALGCLSTVLVTYLLKDLLGRTRPNANLAGIPLGDWLWTGPAKGFTGGSRFGSFPSAHTTGAFALSVGLSWYYPRARALFMSLATITASLRVLHAAHFLSDVIAGMGIAVIMTRSTLHARIPGRLIALLPPPLQEWYLQKSPAD